MVSYEFHIADFSKQYQVPPLEVFHALKILEEEGFIQLNEQFYSPSSLQITVRYKDLYAFEIANAKFEKLLKAILRVYGGEIYQQPLFIDEKQLADSSGILLKDVQQQLQFLHKQGILQYRAKSDSPRITFLQGRHDATKLPLNKSYLEDRKKLKTEQIEAIIQYVENTNLCRTVQILRYFGEDFPDDCGVCDVCIRKKPKKTEQEYSLQKDIEKLVTSTAMHYNSIVEHFPNFSSEYIIKVLRYMDEQGLISIDQNGIVMKARK
jgi:ATP-dependent DNA helicase RecQ